MNLFKFVLLNNQIKLDANENILVHLMSWQNNLCFWFFSLGHKIQAHSLSSPLSWEQKKTQMDTVCCPLFSTATCSSNIFSPFLDPFDILGSHNSLSSSHLCASPPHILFAFTALATTSPSLLVGGPVWGSLPSIAGASDCGIGRSRWSRPDQSHQFHHLVPTVPDDNVGIPHAAHQAWSNLQHRSGFKGSEGPGNMDTCTTIQYTKIQQTAHTDR